MFAMENDDPKASYEFQSQSLAGFIEDLGVLYEWDGMTGPFILSPRTASWLNTLVGTWMKVLIWITMQSKPWPPEVL